MPNILSAKMIFGYVTLAISTLCLLASLSFHLQITKLLPFEFSEIVARQALIQSGHKSIDFAERAVRVSPARAINEVILARALILNAKTIDVEAIEHFRASYAKQPLSSDTHAMRLALIFQNWQSMPSDLKLLAQEEATQYARRPAGRAFLKDLSIKIDTDASFAISIAISRGRVFHKTSL